MRMAVVTLVTLAFQSLSQGQVPGLPSSAKDELAGNLRSMLLKNLPDPLYEAAPNWGQQKPSARLKFRGKLADLRLDVEHPLKNDGTWRRLRVEAIQPADTLVFDIRNLTNPEPGRLLFRVFSSLDIQANFQEQHWEIGLKILDIKARARARAKVILDCEVTTRTETVLGILPEMVITGRVLGANLSYDNLKFEHLAGVGGEAAELLGEAGHKLMNQWKPSIERNLLEKGSAAIVKAGQDKEIRVGLGKLLK